jgi:hypothetical protein
MIDDTHDDISMDDIKAFCIGMNMTNIENDYGGFPDGE